RDEHGWEPVDRRREVRACLDWVRSTTLSAYRCGTHGVPRSTVSHLRTAPMPDYDSPWKEMLDGYFPAFIAFFFPEAHADIDWTRGYESLDTDLQQIVRDAALGTRLADKLMKVWRRDGTEQIVLIHTEIQGTREADFAKRIYVYNYRL